MAAMSNATHRKTKPKPGSRIPVTFTDTCNLSVSTKPLDSLSSNSPSDWSSGGRSVSGGINLCESS